VSIVRRRLVRDVTGVEVLNMRVGIHSGQCDQCQCGQSTVVSVVIAQWSVWSVSVWLVYSGQCCQSTVVSGYPQWSSTLRSARSAQVAVRRLVK